MKNYQFNGLGVWEMERNKEYTPDIESLYRTMLYDLDLAYYNNCHYWGPVVPFRKALGYMAIAMPSLAYIDPHRTREIMYNLNATVSCISHPNLSNTLDLYDSDTLRAITNALAGELYHLVSGRNLHDALVHKCVESLMTRMNSNYSSKQSLLAIETVTGRFDMYTNLLALMVFELHDRIFNTDYSKNKAAVLSTLNSLLKDPGTGLYYEAYQTGCLGSPREELNSKSFWSIKNIKAAPNALTLGLLHYFCPEEAENLLTVLKKHFRNYLLELTLEDIQHRAGSSFLTQLGPHLEDLFASLWLAKEMKDEEFFNELQHHMYELCDPKHVEAKMFYPNLGNDGPLVTYFGLLAQCHIGWKTLLNHSWSDYYGMDYNRVR